MQDVQQQEEEDLGSKAQQRKMKKMLKRAQKLEGFKKASPFARIVPIVPQTKIAAAANEAL